MNETRYTFYSQDQRICGILTRPDDTSAPVPAVLILHGYTGFREKGFAALAADLAAHGLASLRIDLRGSGESGGARGDIYPNSHWLEDASAALNLLSSTPWIDPDRLALVGLSMGGGLAIALAAGDTRVRCTVALAPVADGEDFLRYCWLARKGEAAWQEFRGKVRAAMSARLVSGTDQWFPLWEVMPMVDDRAVASFIQERIEEPLLTRDVTLASADSVMRFTPYQVASSITTPVLFLHDPADPIVPCAHSQRLLSLVQGEKQFFEVPGGEHNLVVGPRQAWVRQTTVAWIKKYL